MYHGAEYILLLNCYITSRDYMFKLLLSEETPHNNFHPANFVSHFYRGSWDITFSICQENTSSKVQTVENFVLKNVRKEMMKAKWSNNCNISRLKYIFEKVKYNGMSPTPSQLIEQPTRISLGTTLLDYILVISARKNALPYNVFD